MLIQYVAKENEEKREKGIDHTAKSDENSPTTGLLTFFVYYRIFIKVGA